MVERLLVVLRSDRTVAIAEVGWAGGAATAD